MDNRLSILVGSCDSYIDIVELYLSFLTTNWSDCPYNIYVATENIRELSTNKASVLACGNNTTWTQRIIYALKNINTPYVLLTVDDLFISEKVKTKEFESILDFVENEGIKYYRIPVLLHNENRCYYPKNKNAVRISFGKPYAVSIGSSIWNKEELLRILGDGSKSAWELEQDFSTFSMSRRNGYIEGYAYDDRYLLHSVHMIKGGKWIRKGAQKIQQLGYQVDFSKRGFTSWKEDARAVVFGTASRICPNSLRKPIKTFMSIFGVKFATKS